MVESWLVLDGYSNQKFCPSRNKACSCAGWHATWLALYIYFGLQTRYIPYATETKTVCIEKIQNHLVEK